MQENRFRKRRNRTVAQFLNKGPRPTILVVEDDNRVRDAVCGVLNAAGYRVLAAASSSHARELLKPPNSVDVLFADITLPGKNGFQLAEDLRGAIPHLKVLLASGYPEYNYSEIKREMQVLHLAKPYSAALLLQSLNAMVGTGA